MRYKKVRMHAAFAHIGQSYHRVDLAQFKVKTDFVVGSSVLTLTVSLWRRSGRKTNHLPSVQAVFMFTCVCVCVCVCVRVRVCVRAHTFLACLLTHRFLEVLVKVVNSLHSWCWLLAFLVGMCSCIYVCVCVRVCARVSLGRVNVVSQNWAKWSQLPWHQMSEQSLCWGPSKNSCCVRWWGKYQNSTLTISQL